MIAPPALHRTLNAIELERFAATLAERRDRWQEMLDALGARERAFIEIWSDAFVNAWAIRWTTGADTGFHDHDLAAAGITVVDGSIVEERLTLSGSPIARQFEPGRTFSVPPSAIHRVRHVGGPIALTIHVYSPPLRVQGVYTTSHDGALERRAVAYTEELRNELVLRAA
ncbi:MAG: cysteine dioxygenase family protein [Solirubrobacteraceae bacterium]|jgi:hypothetical protein